jgi:nitroimidazol reductase NimA-like FMN-containing flavoprotein (pyridoxamine 5'-phosphate oxidase superfamily)/quercetin dioxygenase-like cupin family protein
MRKSRKEIKDRDVIIDLLNTCHVGRLGTIGRDGYPMVKPLNFAYDPPLPHFSKGGQGGFGKIYFHTAKEGEKIDDIRRDSRVCFEVDLPIAYVKGTESDPCKAEYLYRSVIIKGRAHIVENKDELISGLKCLMKKYQPEGGYGDFLEEKLNITGVVRIDIEEMVGKEDLGKEGMKQEHIMNKTKVYHKDSLAMKPSVPGAKMWAVGLDKAMLTYFEMEADTKFPEHSHEAEQITLILEGELTFAYEGRTVTLRPGEVIAIPSNAVHSASTGNKPCKAVDAWSPVRKEFL